MSHHVLRNRDLTSMAPSTDRNIFSETTMSDILYLAIGLGTFLLLALYTRSLGRI